MKKIQLIMLICLLTSCVKVETDSYTDVRVTPVNATFPEQPGFTIDIVGNMRSQKYLLEYFINDEKTFTKWVLIYSDKTYRVNLDLNPGSYEIRVKLSLNTGYAPYVICNKTITLNYH